VIPVGASSGDRFAWFALRENATWASAVSLPSQQTVALIRGGSMLQRRSSLAAASTLMPACHHAPKAGGQFLIGKQQQRSNGTTAAKRQALCSSAALVASIVVKLSGHARAEHPSLSSSLLVDWQVSLRLALLKAPTVSSQTALPYTRATDLEPSGYSAL
jgi:hypothetical protein